MIERPMLFPRVHPPARSAASTKAGCPGPLGGGSGEGEPVSAEQDDPAAAQTLYEQGEASYGRGDLKSARQSYADLANRFPTDARADDAKRRMAEIDLKERHYGDAEQSLKTRYAHTPPADRPKAAQTLAAAAEGAGDGVEAVRDYCRVGEARSVAARRGHPRRPHARGRAAAVGQRRRAPGGGPSFSDCPAQEPMAFKRALTLAHIGDPQAQGALEDALTRYPQGAAAPQAREALERLRARAAQEQKPGAIGLLIPQSPDSFSAYGKAALEGFKLGLGESVHFIVRDTKGDPAEAKKAVDDLAAQGVLAIAGPILSNEAEAAAARAQELGIPIVTLTKAEGITRVGPYVFRNMLTDSAQARALAHYAVDLRGYKRFAVLYPDVEYGKQMMSLFWDQVESKGGRFGAARSRIPSTPPPSAPSSPPAGGPLRSRGAARLPRGPARDQREGAESHPAKESPAAAAREPAAAARLRRHLHRRFGAQRGAGGAGPGQREHPHGRLRPGRHADHPAHDRPQAGIRSSCSAGRPGPIRTSISCSAPGAPWSARSTSTGSSRRASGPGPRPRNEGLPGRLRAGCRASWEAEAYDTGRLMREALKAASRQTRDAFREAFAGLKGVPGAAGQASVAADREVEKPLFFVTVTDKEGTTGGARPRQGLAIREPRRVTMPVSLG